MLIFQDQVLARPSESMVGYVNASSLSYIFQDLALGQGSQGQRSAMSIQQTCIELRYHLNRDMKV